MSISGLNSVLKKAQQEKYGILATVIYNFDYTEAIISAAVEKRSPIVLMVSDPLQRQYNYFNFKHLIGPVRDMAEESDVPIVLHLDHGSDYETIMYYIDYGINSVMVSGVSDFSKNVEKTKKVVKAAHRRGAAVEGELGMIEGEGGVEGRQDAGVTREEIERSYTIPSEARTFFEYTGVDALAVSVGTSHGFFSFEPRINFGLIKKLAANVDAFLVVHGASGLKTEDYRKMIKNGIVKMNYYTGLIEAATEEAKKYLNTRGPASFTNLNARSMKAVSDKAKELIEIFGSSGKA